MTAPAPDPALAVAALQSLGDALYVVDRNRRIQLWNGAAERLTGFTEDEVVGRSCRDRILNHVDCNGVELCAGLCPLAATVQDGQPREARVFLHHRDGHRQLVSVRATAIRDEHGEIIGATEVFCDDDEVVAVRRRLAELEALALTDPVTGLGNRRHGEAELSRWLASWERYGDRFGVLVVDVDRFKAVNDTWGHDVGDRALRMVGTSLAYGLRSTDVVVRWGGEEFVVLVRVGDTAALRQAAERLRVLVAGSRLDLDDDAAVALTVSIGGTLVEPGETGASTRALLARADQALYRAKTDGRDRVVIPAAVPAVDLTARLEHA